MLMASGHGEVKVVALACGTDNLMTATKLKLLVLKGLHFPELVAPHSTRRSVACMHQSRMTNVPH